MVDPARKFGCIKGYHGKKTFPGAQQRVSYREEAALVVGKLGAAVEENGLPRRRLTGFVYSGRRKVCLHY